MNNTFELKRFNLVFKKLLFERSLSLWGGFILFSFVAWITYPYPRNSELINNWVNERANLFGIFLILSGIYWVSMGFNYFSNREEETNYLLLPASYFEKWLSVVVLLGLFSAFYFAFFRALDTTYVVYYRNHLDPANRLYRDLYNTAQVMPFLRDGNSNSYSFFFTITGVIAVGSLYFNKMSLIKTLLFFIGFNIAFYFFQAKIADIFFQTKTSAGTQMQWITITKTDEKITLPVPFFAIYSFISIYFIPIIFWLIALIRLREKEI
jgi:hypothetical protein